VGSWPFCKDGHAPAKTFVIDDTLEGGARFFDTMGHEPVWIESKSQWRREVAARELVNVDRHDSAYYETRARRTAERRKDLGLD
jgi:hypothetical protein